MPVAVPACYTSQSSLHLQLVLLEHLISRSLAPCLWPLWPSLPLGLQHIMYNITIRNCSRSSTGVTNPAYIMLTHSDEFVPEFMQVRLQSAGSCLTRGRWRQTCPTTSPEGCVAVQQWSLHAPGRSLIACSLAAPQPSRS